MIGGCVGVASGAGDSPGPGVAPGTAVGDGVGSPAGTAPADGDAPGLGDAPGDADSTGDGETPGLGAGVTALAGGFTGPDGGGGAGGFTCASAPSARAQTNARLVNGARTRRNRLLSRGEGGQAIFWAAGSRETADARSVL